MDSTIRFGSLWDGTDRQTCPHTSSLMKRSIAGALLFVGVLLPVWSGGAAERGREAGSSPEGIRAEVSYIEGYVRVNGEAASFGQTVPPGAKIRTGAQSYCDITFAQKNIMRIEPNTLTTITIGKERRSIDLEKGSIDAVFDRLESISGIPDFRITSPSMVAGVRGTVFYIRVEDPDSTYLCTCYGTLIQRGSMEEEEDTREVTADHHKAYRYMNTTEGTKVESAGLLYHDDEAMDAVADRIDVDIPWGEGKAYE